MTLSLNSTDIVHIVLFVVGYMITAAIFIVGIYVTQRVHARRLDEFDKRQDHQDETNVALLSAVNEINTKVSIGVAKIEMLEKKLP